MADEVVIERPEGLAGGNHPVTPLTMGLVAAVPALVLALIVTFKVRKALRDRGGPVSSRRGGSLRPPPGPDAGSR